VRVVGECVQLEVADDGRGVAPDTPRGFGLASMERRLMELSGSLQLEPRPPHGTLLHAEIPRLDRHPG
jgi:signal transduction histidine kinase